MFGLINAPPQAAQKPSLLGRLGNAWRERDTPGADGNSFMDKLGLLGAQLRDVDGGNAAPALMEQLAGRNRQRQQDTAAQQERAQLAQAADELGLTGAKKLQFLIDPAFRRDVIAPKRDVRQSGNDFFEIPQQGDVQLLYDGPDKPEGVPTGMVEGEDGNLTWRPGYLESQRALAGATTGARRDAVVSRPMPSRARARAPARGGRSPAAHLTVEQLLAIAGR